MSTHYGGVGTDVESWMAPRADARKVATHDFYGIKLQQYLQTFAGHSRAFFDEALNVLEVNRVDIPPRYAHSVDSVYSEMIRKYAYRMSSRQLPDSDFDAFYEVVEEQMHRMRRLGYAPSDEVIHRLEYMKQHTWADDARFQRLVDLAKRYRMHDAPHHHHRPAAGDEPVAQRPTGPGRTGNKLSVLTDDVREMLQF
jgi:hypothetical protein